MIVHTTMFAALLLMANPLVAQTPQESAATAPVVSDPAIEIARSLAPREQLRGFILMTLAKTTTGQIIARKLGAAEAEALFRAEAAKAVEKHGAQWEANLAAAWRETLTQSELETALRAARDRDAATLMPFMQRVGPVMQTNSTALLQQASLEAMTAAYAQIDQGS